MQQSVRAKLGNTELSWRVLGLLNLFRLIVPVVLLSVTSLLGQPHVDLDGHAELLRDGCYGYFLTGLVLIAVLKQRTHTSVWHVYVPVVIDITILSLIVYASGGAESGLSILLLVPVGALSVIAGTRGSLLIAASAVLALLGQQFVAYLLDGVGPVGFAQAGYYGAGLLLSAAGGAAMTRRLRESEAVIRQRDIDLANFAQLSEYIVQHLRESILVVDSEDRVRLINESARQLLGPEAQPGGLLGEISPRLLYHVESWRRRPEGNSSESRRSLTSETKPARACRRPWLA